MSNIYLSDETYKVLLQLAKSPIRDISGLPESSIAYLHDLDFIKCYISEYDTSSGWIIPKFSEYAITEKGLGYICNRQTSEYQSLFDTLSRNCHYMFSEIIDYLNQAE